MIRKILLVLLIVLVVIQFIKPTPNKTDKASMNNIAAVYTVPGDVQDMLKKACNDCHSNNTVYPWYSKVQPVAWWLQHHINEGKKELNFDEFATYSAKKQHHKLDELIEQVKKGEMPLNSYTWIHKDAVLSDQEKNSLVSWADGLMKEIAVKNNLPAEEEKKAQE
ncbi:MAG TPA: heme-binding domain-containing protein [Chitinophagaceae bacterium]|nr:heme-binding domain-containing protein [Chitinophagaceae bacterium]